MLRPPAGLLPWSGQLRRAKLRAPSLPEDAIMRPRLLQRIESEARPLILVVAPAGFGKTTLAAQWAVQGPPTGWLTADPRDGLLDRFWAHLRAALVETTGDALALGEVVSSSLAMPHRTSALDLGRLLADELLDVPGMRLVIDDVHLVPAGESHDFLTGLLEIAPPGLQLLITSRVEPPLPLNRMRLRGAVTEIRGDDLLFTTSEAGSFVGQSRPDHDDAQAVLDGLLRTGNSAWAAELRLVTLANAGQDGATGGSGLAAESEQDLLTWLLDETLAGRPGPERAALLHASLLEHFNARLVMAADLQPASTVGEAIEFATRADLCRRSVRNDGDWLQFHPLFRDALRQQLAREEAPSAIRTVHRRAAAWFAETGYIDEALDHYLAAGDVATAVAIVERGISPAFNREDWPSVARWLAKLPPDVIQRTPRLLLAQGMVAQFRGQPVPIAEIQIALERQLARGEWSEQERASLRGELDSLRVNSSTSDSIDLPSCLEATQRAIQRIDPAHRFELGVAWMHYGMALSAAGKHQQAIERLQTWIEASTPPVDAGSMRGFLGLLLVHAQAGSLALSEATARTTIALAEQHGLRLMTSWGHRFLGDALYELNDLDGAIEHYSAAARDHEYFHLIGLREAFFGLALSYLANGRRDEAERALRRSRDIMIASGVVHHLPAIEAQEAYVALLAGDRESAKRWAKLHNHGIGSESLSIPIIPAMIHATIHCAAEDRQDVNRGLAALARIRQEMTYWRFPGPMVRLDALRAVTLMRCGERDAAIAAMRAAGATARANGHIRSFLDLLPLFPSELENLAATVMLPPAVQQILRQPAAAGSQPVAAARSPLDALTEREQEVLGYLVQRLSYNEIGDQLYISPHTVKRHVTSIYSKLGVAGRLEAIRAARELGWSA